jgi:hypothetical protein
MKMGKWVCRLGIAALSLVTMAFVSGCEDDDNGSGGGNVVGNWELRQSSGGDNVSWWKFNSDGTMGSYDDPGLNALHFSGTYKQSGNKVTGSFTNPGVGEGEIDCTVSADGTTMEMDFIEHWHSPYKHVPYSGTRM